ncbi:MAG: hypothetical protein AABY22_15950 [Nanoarchaeota archaeon]
MENSLKAYSLLNRASVIKVESFLLHNWQLEDYKDWIDFEDDEPVFTCSYTKFEEGLTWDFEFTKKSFEDAKIVDNIIEMMDNKGELVMIKCFKLTSLKYED